MANTTPAPTTAETIKSAGTIIVTVLIFIMAAFWTYVLFTKLGADIKYDDKGQVTKDEFARAKDIFTIIFPLLTIAAGYWLGSQGKEKAEEKAKDAQTQKDVVQRREAAFREVADASLIDRAKRADPGAFGLREDQVP